MTGALSGLRVVDFSRMLAGPICSLILAELGAEVIKVEMRGSGDAIRQNPPLTGGGDSHIFVLLNRGKKSVTLDTRLEEGRKIALELIAKSDIVVENYAAGVMERMGLDYEEAIKVNPKIIYASVTGFGQTGPYSDKVSLDIVAQAMSGIMTMTGFPDSPPTRCGPAMGDESGALFASIGILAALQHRNATGQGQHIDISLQDCLWMQTSLEFLPWYVANNAAPMRVGNMNISTVPWNLYKTRDGYATVSIVTVGQWQKLAELMGRPDLTTDPDKLTVAYRIEHRADIDGLVAKWAAGLTTAEMQRLMDNAGLACAPVLDIAQVVADPHINSREMVVEVDQPLSGKMKSPGTVFKMSRTPGDPRQPAAFLGEHNAEVYGGLLGYSEHKIKELMDKEIV